MYKKLLLTGVASAALLATGISMATDTPTRYIAVYNSAGVANSGSGGVYRAANPINTAVAGFFWGTANTGSSSSQKIMKQVLTSLKGLLPNMPDTIKAKNADAVVCAAFNGSSLDGNKTPVAGVSGIYYNNNGNNANPGIFGVGPGQPCATVVGIQLFASPPTSSGTKRVFASSYYPVTTKGKLDYSQTAGYTVLTPASATTATTPPETDLLVLGPNNLTADGTGDMTGTYIPNVALFAPGSSMVADAAKERARKAIKQSKEAIAIISDEVNADGGGNNIGSGSSGK